MHMEINYILFRGLYHMEAKMLIDWFEEIAENYDIDVCYTNDIIDDMTNNVSFNLKKFDFSVHTDYIELVLKKHNNERATIYAMDFNEIVLK